MWNVENTNENGDARFIPSEGAACTSTSSRISFPFASLSCPVHAAPQKLSLTKSNLTKQHVNLCRYSDVHGT